MWRGFTPLSWLAVIVGDDDDYGCDDDDEDHDHGCDDDYDDGDYDDYNDAPLPNVKRLHPAELVGSFKNSVGLPLQWS